jgi:diguanylate cyclase (GGDEF)-like protein
MAAHAIAQLLIVPLVVGETCLGAMRFASRRAETFGDAALRLGQEIAAQTALAVQNARHLDDAKRYAEEQSTLLRLSQAVISNHDLFGVLKQIAEAALGLDGVDGCRIALWREEMDAAELAADATVDDWSSLYRPGERLPLADWPSYRDAVAHGRIRAFHAIDPDIHARERANLLADGIHSATVIPIMIGEEGQGFLALHARQRRRVGEGARRFARELAAQAAAAIDRARLFDALQRRAETDGLTGLLNHRAAQEAMDRELAVARVARTPLSVILVDLDDFKLFNDTHGHLLGDRVLCEAAAALRACSRPGDLAARYGGDEFLLILPGASATVATAIGERLLKRISGTTVGTGVLDLPIRISVGAATFPHDGRNRQDLIGRADAAMYAAKDLGGGAIGEAGRATRTLEPTAFGALSGLVRAVDRKDRYTKDHSDMVRDFAVAFGTALGLPKDQIEALDIAGQLHDVGKIAVPDLILRKPGQLDVEEEATMRQHVVFGELMIKGVPHLGDVLAGVAHHHERWDGGGYPYGKSGPEIPLLGRILALADAYAAMTHDRPYRRGRSRQQAVAELRAGAGTQFDPDLVEPFIAAVAPAPGETGERTAAPGKRAVSSGFLMGDAKLRVARPDVRVQTGMLAGG